MSNRIIVIGASAGGVEAMIHLVGELPADLPAPIFLVLHVPADSPSLLPTILSRRGELKAKHAEDGERYRDGILYVAPPDRHMLIDRRGRVQLIRGPRENRHRPAIDPLFRSAAVAQGRNVVAVILSGALDDGTAGLIAVKQRGGFAIVQDPADAVYPSMPKSAIEHVEVDAILPLRDIAAKLVEIAAQPLAVFAAPVSVENLLEFETRVAAMDSGAMNDDERPGEPSPFSCPDCGGVLWELDDGEMVRYRCRVGHAFSPETMLGAQSEKLEEALWTAMKTLDESASLAKRLAANEHARGHKWMAERFEGRERDARTRADAIRRFLLDDTGEVPVEVEAPRSGG